MKHLLFSLFLWSIIMPVAMCTNYVLRHGESSRIYVHYDNEGSELARADRLFADDYQEVFGAGLAHTARIEDARIIACSYDHPALRKYARLRGISFESLSERPGAFMLKVHNGGTQLFVVGSDERSAAFGLMTLSRQWGVSPFRWWVDAPALPVREYELDVVYEHTFQASIPERVLLIAGAQQHDRYLRDLALRLRATQLSGQTDAVSPVSDSGERLGTYVCSLTPASDPYLGLNLALQHPERLRIEALRAFDHGRRSRWIIDWQHQLGGELQLVELFDIAWDVESFRDAYYIDQLEDQHYSQMSGLPSTWSQLWNDFYDLAMNFHPSSSVSVESLRRGIGEGQALALQLSLELNDKVVNPSYEASFFRTIEYPVYVLASQIQRLCHLQLLRHGMGTQWSVDDCAQRMSLLCREINERVTPRWRQLLGAALPPLSQMDLSLQQTDGSQLSMLQHSIGVSLPALDTLVLLYRSTRATGTQVLPFQVLRIPVNYQAPTMHLLLSFLPVTTFDKPVSCTISVDNASPRLVVIDPSMLGQSYQSVDELFDIDPTVESHTISIRTVSDGIFLQRIWLQDMQ